MGIYLGDLAKARFPGRLIDADSDISAEINWLRTRYPESKSGLLCDILAAIETRWDAAPQFLWIEFEPCEFLLLMMDFRLCFDLKERGNA